MKETQEDEITKEQKCDHCEKVKKVKIYKHYGETEILCDDCANLPTIMES